jgi:hypothetical protein
LKNSEVCAIVGHCLAIPVVDGARMEIFLALVVRRLLCSLMDSFHCHGWLLKTRPSRAATHEGLIILVVELVDRVPPHAR